MDDDDITFLYLRIAFEEGSDCLSGEVHVGLR